MLTHYVLCFSQGHLCRRCLRIADDNRSCLGDEDDETASLIESLMSEADQRYILAQLQESLASADSDNPYRILVQKYEELVRAQRKIQSQSGDGVGSGGQPLSLQEELEMSGLGGTQSSGPNSGSLGYHDSAPLSLQEELDMSHSSHQLNQKTPVSQKTSRDFCESDTSSSGFSDDISNKSTQTEVKYLPGAFLCTISDGEDCRFSIYDDASPVESRFRKTPEYRTLFREIFDVLKRAAEAKDEGEKLPLLDDTLVGDEQVVPKVPPGTPAREDLPLLKLIEDNQSIISEEPSEYDLQSNADTSLDYLQIEQDSTLADRAEMDRESIVSCDSVNSSTLKRSKRSRRKNRKRDVSNSENENKGAGESLPAAGAERNTERLGEVEVTRGSESSTGKTTGLATSGIKPASTAVKALGDPNVGANTVPARTDSVSGSPAEVLKPRRDIFEDLIEGVKSRKKSKRQARLLDDRRDTPSPPALVGINNVFVSNKLLRRTRRHLPGESPRESPSRVASVPVGRYETPYAVNASSAAQEVAKLKILEKSYAEVLKNNSRHHHNQKHRTTNCEYVYEISISSQ
ncbi:hypothetical protein M8J75_008933 [Diaphorina citri]|nr:hypothetical protein M8J75_008933 [Diaphorina citri]